MAEAVAEPRMYQLVRPGKPIRAFEIRFHDQSAHGYVFTFGQRGDLP